MNELDVDTARWLVSPPGLDAVDAATALLDGGADDLEVATRLRRDVVSSAAVAAAVTAAVARRRARSTRPRAEAWVFTRESLEQASHPLVSAWRAQRYRDLDVWDLCAGVGGDAAALAATARSVTVVELDPARAVLLGHNLHVAGGRATVVHGDALDVQVDEGAVVHADPARRRDGHRVRRLREHLPSIPLLLERHARAPGHGVVLSPAVDLDDPDLPSDAELEFCQVDGRLVEAVIWTGVLRRDAAAAAATLLPGGAHRSRPAGERDRLAVGPLGDHLVEVAPAAVRARLHDTIGGELDARRLSSRRALLTCDGPPPASPWYQARPVVGDLPAHPRAVRRWLRSREPGPVEIVLHGVAGDVERWWRELGRPPRGPSGFRIEVVRLDHGARTIVTDARKP